MYHTRSKTDRLLSTGRNAISNAAPSSISQLWGTGRGRSTPLGPQNKGKGRAYPSGLAGPSQELADSEQESSTPANSDEEDIDEQLNPQYHEETPQANGGHPGTGGNGNGGDDNANADNGGNGADDDNNTDNGDTDNNPGNPGPVNPVNPEPNSNLLLAAAIQNLNRGIRRLRPSSNTKVKEPETFDGTNPNKLREFLVSCSLVFSDRPDSFKKDEKMVRYVISYLKGSALDWFEPIIMGDVDDVPDWLYDYTAFVKELTDHFGPYDFRGDAETALSNLSMKENQRITKYIVDFNKLASRTDWNEPALRDRFFRGLPIRIRTELLRGGKPKTLVKMRLKAQQVDQAHWITKDEVAKDTKPAASSDNKKDGNSSKQNSFFKKRPHPGSENRSTNNSGSRFNSTNPSNPSSSKPSSSSKKPDISDKLGKDGKLRTDERKRRMEKNLCLYCGAGGHSAKDCRKASSSRGRAAVASSSGPSDSVTQPPTSESSGTKK
jgi:Retrotransposon gag protein